MFLLQFLQNHEQGFTGTILSFCRKHRHDLHFLFGNFVDLHKLHIIFMFQFSQLLSVIKSNWFNRCGLTWGRCKPSAHLPALHLSRINNVGSHCAQR